MTGARRSCVLALAVVVVVTLYSSTAAGHSWPDQRTRSTSTTEADNIGDSTNVCGQVNNYNSNNYVYVNTSSLQITWPALGHSGGSVYLSVVDLPGSSAGYTPTYAEITASQYTDVGIYSLLSRLLIFDAGMQPGYKVIHWEWTNPANDITYMSCIDMLYDPPVTTDQTTLIPERSYTTQEATVVDFDDLVNQRATELRNMVIIGAVAGVCCICCMGAGVGICVTQGISCCCGSKKKKKEKERKARRKARRAAREAEYEDDEYYGEDDEYYGEDDEYYGDEEGGTAGYGAPAPTSTGGYGAGGYGAPASQRPPPPPSYADTGFESANSNDNMLGGGGYDAYDQKPAPPMPSSRPVSVAEDEMYAVGY